MAHNARQPASLTLNELAARWGVTRRTLDTWRAKGRPMPPHCRWLGRQPIRFLLSDVEKFEAQNR